LPESSHPPAALTVSGDAGSITRDAEGEALATIGAVDAGRDEGKLVAATPAPDGLAAPAQPATAMTIVTMATLDFIIG
jgi:hypothetical protein